MTTDLNQWRRRHAQAMTSPVDIERPMVDLLSGLAEYVERYPDDYVLRVGLADIINGIAVLLNGDLGRLDGGTLDSILRQCAADIGYDRDTQEFTS